MAGHMLIMPPYSTGVGGNQMDMQESNNMQVDGQNNEVKKEELTEKEAEEGSVAKRSKVDPSLTLGTSNLVGAHFEPHQAQ